MIERLTPINGVTMKDATMTDETLYDNNATVNSEVETELQAELLDMYRRKGPDNYFFAWHLHPEPAPYRLLLMPGKAWRKSSLIGSSFLFVALMASTMEILVTEDSSSTCDGRGRLVIIKFASHLFITKLRKGRGQPRSAIQVKLKQACRNTI